MKFVSAVILFFAFAAQTFDKAFIEFDYYSNKARYAMHCENADKPMMHCNGQCMLKKKLQREENNDRHNPEGRPENKSQISLFSKSYFVSLTPVIFADHTTGYARQIVGKERKMPRSFFHPPAA